MAWRDKRRHEDGTHKERARFLSHAGVRDRGVVVVRRQCPLDSLYGRRAFERLAPLARDLEQVASQPTRAGSKAVRFLAPRPDGQGVHGSESEETRDRLIALLGYCKEITKLGREGADSSLELRRRRDYSRPRCAGSSASAARRPRASIDSRARRGRRLDPAAAAAAGARAAPAAADGRRARRGSRASATRRSSRLTSEAMRDGEGARASRAAWASCAGARPTARSSTGRSSRCRAASSSTRTARSSCGARGAAQRARLAARGRAARGGRRARDRARARGSTTSSRGRSAASAEDRRAAADRP